MKVIKISDSLHTELTIIVGELIAKSCRVKTYEDAVESLLHNSVIMEPELLEDIEKFIRENKQLGYTSKEEFLRASSRWLIHDLSRAKKREALQANLQLTSPEQIAINDVQANANGGG